MEKKEETRFNEKLQTWKPNAACKSFHVSCVLVSGGVESGRDTSAQQSRSGAFNVHFNDSRELWAWVKCKCNG